MLYREVIMHDKNKHKEYSILGIKDIKGYRGYRIEYRDGGWNIYMPKENLFRLILKFFTY